MTDVTPLAIDRSLSIRTVSEERVWVWLSAGWRDMRRVPGVSLAYGAAFVAVSFLLPLGLWLAEMLSLVRPLAAGFMFIGPLVAVGLYEVSRRLERGERATLGDAVVAWRANAGQIPTMGGVLMLFLLAWIRIAFLVFALFFGASPPSWDLLIQTVFFSVEGVPFLLAGTAAGAVLAAIAASVTAVWRNRRVMIGWAALIALFTAAGLATFYIGLALTLPLIGHATWHAYRDLVVVAP